jgi:N-acetylglucosaminyldiphosphoundecaprenol N-acetyl-beta-D-mannosaminyltransferase
MSTKRLSVLGARINALTWDDALTQILTWGAGHESRYVSMCNVHSVVTTTQDHQFKSVINNADLALADGAPIAWAIRKLGHIRQERISGPDLMWRYLAEAEHLAQVVFFFGGTNATLEKLSAAVGVRFPKLLIGGIYSPSFLGTTVEEDERHVTAINRSGANVVFVGLGCPKQEIWMAAHRGRIGAVMIGVGAAFDFHAGTIKRAPLWWQRNGLEWLYRLCSEPKRLFRRYLVTNTLFLVGITRQLINVAMSRK